MQAAVGHAVSFPTWQSLVRQQGLDDAEAVAVMAALVESAGGARPTKAEEADPRRALPCPPDTPLTVQPLSRQQEARGADQDP